MNDIRPAVLQWISDLETSLATGDREAWRNLFTEQLSWRDLVSFTWNLRQFHGRDLAEDYMFLVREQIAPHDFRLDDEYPAGSITVASGEGDDVVLEVHFRFETATGSADGLARLSRAAPGGAMVCSVVLTRLLTLTGAVPRWPVIGRMDDEQVAAERRRHDERRTYSTKEPEVLVVGGGQNGITMAAELERLGIDNVVVDRWPRAGDMWRNRYSSLVLHNPRAISEFLHLPYPVTIPDFLSKDQLADWMEMYVRALDINAWHETDFAGATFDEEMGRWTARLRTSDGGERILRPRYLVLATGLSGKPKIPEFEGLTGFTGAISHSSEFKTGEDFTGKRVLVVGIGTSAHDIALEITVHGGSADMLQRGAIAATNLSTAYKYWTGHREFGGNTSVADKRLLAGRITPLLLESFRVNAASDRIADKELLEGLEKAGMRIHDDEYGWMYRYFESASGYYINVGASEAVIDGRIRVRQASDLTRITTTGADFGDEHVDYDAIVFATGYYPPQAVLQEYFGSEVAQRIGRVGGFDEYGDLDRNLYRPIPGQPNLFINAGGLAAARTLTPLVALVMQAQSAGLIPHDFLDPAHPSRGPREPAVNTSATESRATVTV